VAIGAHEPGSREIERRVEAGERIAEVDLRRWMQASDLETQGAVVALLDEHQHLLAGPPSLNETVDFYLGYFRRCIEEDPAGEFAASRYVAAHALVNWYRKMRDDPQVPPEVLVRARRMLREAYEAGDSAVRECIVNGALEHLFEEEAVREEFAEWKRQPQLREAYERALEWSSGGGHDGTG
jgi:hypothetical protein